MYLVSRSNPIQKIELFSPSECFGDHQNGTYDSILISRSAKEPSNFLVSVCTAGKSGISDYTLMVIMSQVWTQILTLKLLSKSRNYANRDELALIGQQKPFFGV